MERRFLKSMVSNEYTVNKIFRNLEIENLGRYR